MKNFYRTNLVSNQQHNVIMPSVITVRVFCVSIDLDYVTLEISSMLPYLVIDFTWQLLSRSLSIFSIVSSRGACSCRRVSAFGKFFQYRFLCVHVTWK